MYKCEWLLIMGFLSKVITRSQNGIITTKPFMHYNQNCKTRHNTVTPSLKGNQKQWCKVFFSKLAGIVIQNPLTNDKSPLGNFEPMDRWMGRDRWMESQTANGQTNWQTDHGNCKKLHRIMCNLRPIWHLKLNPFWNERNLGKKNPWNFDTKTSKAVSMINQTDGN